VKFRKALTGTTLIVITLVGAGCGGSASPKASHGDFVAAVNRACAAYNKQGHALPRPVGAKQPAKYPNAKQALRAKELTALQNVSPPVSDRDAYTRYLAHLAEINVNYGELAAALSNPVDTSSLTKRLKELEPKAKAEAISLGFTECAKDPYSAQHSSNSN
jgi:hypothetical protein